MTAIDRTKMSSENTASTLPSFEPSPIESSNPTPDSNDSQASTFDTQPLSSQEDEDPTPSNVWGQLTVIGGATYG